MQIFVLPLRKQQGYVCVGGSFERYVRRSRGLTDLCAHSLNGTASLWWERQSI